MTTEAKDEFYNLLTAFEATDDYDTKATLAREMTELAEKEVERLSNA